MLNLDQVKILEQKVEQALKLIESLREENKRLRQKLTNSQDRLEELEKLISSFKGDQDTIEKSILNILAKLNQLEDDINEASLVEKKKKDSLNPEKAPAAEPANQLNSPLNKNYADEKINKEINQSSILSKQDELDIF